MIIFSPLKITQIEIASQMMFDFYTIDNYPIDINRTRELFEEFISNKSLGKSYLIYNDKEIIGYFIITFIFSFEYQGRIAFLDELYITESNRGNGIGNKTVQFIQGLKKELKIKIIYLEVENHNVKAQKLYLANDFEFHNRKIMKYKTK